MTVILFFLSIIFFRDRVADLEGTSNGSLLSTTTLLYLSFLDTDDSKWSLDFDFWCSIALSFHYTSSWGSKAKEDETSTWLHEQMRAELRMNLTSNDLIFWNLGIPSNHCLADLDTRISRKLDTFSRHCTSSGDQDEIVYCSQQLNMSVQDW